jgi:sec-independent protein translocase protein TatA
MYTLAIIQGISGWEWIIIGLIALLLFGRRLPEVGRSLGKGIVEFKRGLKEIEDDIDTQANRPAPAATAGVGGSTLPPASPTAPPVAADQRVSRSDTP